MTEKTTAAPSLKILTREKFNAMVDNPSERCYRFFPDSDCGEDWMRFIAYERGTNGLVRYAKAFKSLKDAKKAAMGNRKTAN